jgi:hypothetical protein
MGKTDKDRRILFRGRVEQKKAGDHLECPENLKAPINRSDTFNLSSTGIGPTRRT